MTDEQKRALEVLENVCTDDCVNKAFVVEPIKQLIQTQQEEIEDLKWRNEIYVKSIKSHKSEIEKKDKIIDEMAEQIYDEWYIPNIKTVDDVKEYFINKVEKESKDDN